MLRFISFKSTITLQHAPAHNMHQQKHSQTYRYSQSAHYILVLYHLQTCKACMAGTHCIHALNCLRIFFLHRSHIALYRLLYIYIYCSTCTARLAASLLQLRVLSCYHLCATWPPAHLCCVCCRCSL
jgi:hypothetical protein